MAPRGSAACNPRECPTRQRCRSRRRSPCVPATEISAMSAFPRAPATSMVSQARPEPRICVTKIPKMTPEARLLIRCRTPLQHQLLSGRPRDDSLDDVGCEQCEAQNLTDVALRDVLAVADLANDAVHAVVEHPLRLPCAGQRLDQRAVGLPPRAGRIRLPPGGDDALSIEWRWSKESSTRLWPPAIDGPGPVREHGLT